MNRLICWNESLRMLKCEKPCKNTKQNEKLDKPNESKGFEKDENSTSINENDDESKEDLDNSNKDESSDKIDDYENEV